MRIVSADHYFEKFGRFDPSRLPLAHSNCFLLFLEGLREGATKVAIMSGIPGCGKSFQARELEKAGWLVVDNTNLHAWEISPYVLCAEAHGVKTVKIVRVSCDPMKAFARQTHGVPLEAHQRMVNDFSRRDILPWWITQEISN